MKLGLHPMIFSWPGGSAAIEPTLADVLERAEDARIHSIWPMDHFFQIPAAGQGPDAPMLEGWATIAWAAGFLLVPARGLGVPFPPLAERFERLEETLQIMGQMFDG